MFDGVFILSFLGGCVQAIKEACEPTVPAENWGNKELYYKDVANNVPIEQRMKNVVNGKYKLTNVAPEIFSEPHRNPTTGQIIIENTLLYKKDLSEYGAYQAQQWVKQGKYNLTPEELKKEKERLKAHTKYMYSLL